MDNVWIKCFTAFSLFWANVSRSISFQFLPLNKLSLYIKIHVINIESTIQIPLYYKGFSAFVYSVYYIEFSMWVICHEKQFLHYIIKKWFFRVCPGFIPLIPYIGLRYIGTRYSLKKFLKNTIFDKWFDRIIHHFCRLWDDSTPFCTWWMYYLVTFFCVFCRFWHWKHL